MIGVTVCGNIIPFIYHVLGTNAIIKGFMQYVVVVCFIRAACLVVIISAAGIKGEFVGSIESEFLILRPADGDKRCRSRTCRY